MHMINCLIYFSRKWSVLWKNLNLHQSIFSCRMSSCQLHNPAQSWINHVQIYLGNFQIRLSRKLSREWKYFILHFFLIFYKEPLLHVIRTESVYPRSTGAMFFQAVCNVSVGMIKSFYAYNPQKGKSGLCVYKLSTQNQNKIRLRGAKWKPVYFLHRNTVIGS